MIRKINPELIAWTAGLLLLALLDPHAGLPSLCVSQLAGLPDCPGCGLGRSVSHLFHGEIQQSWNSHKLGIPVLTGLLARIYQLAKAQYHTLLYE